MAGQSVAATGPLVTLKPRWYWPIQASTQAVLVSRILAAVLLVVLVLSNPRRFSYVVSGVVILIVLWVVWFVLLSARARVMISDSELRIREVVGHERVVPKASVGGVRLCAIKEAWYAENTILLLGADGQSCVGSLHGRGWRAEHAKTLGTALGVPVTGSFSDVLDSISLQGQPAGLSWAQLNPGLAWTFRLVGGAMLAALTFVFPVLFGR